MSTWYRTPFAIAAIALMVGVALGAGGMSTLDSPSPNEASTSGIDDDPELGTFTSAEDFEEYFTNTQPAISLQAGGTDGAVELDAAAEGDSGGERSGTNVQERGIDEPDVLKTGEDAVYYAGYEMRRADGETHVLDLEDRDDPAVAATIPATGELLLVEDRLLVLGNDRVWGYDVTDPADPSLVWDQPVNGTIETARVVNDTPYLVVAERPDRATCQLTPIGTAAVDCTDVHRPDASADVDAVYTAARLDPASGAIVDDVSVVGSTGSSATYVSNDSIHLSYTRSTSDYALQSAYLTGPGADVLDEETADRVAWLDDLDLSDRAKSIELQAIVEEYLATLDAAEREDVEERLADGLAEYAADRQRDLTRTGIVRIDIDGDLGVAADGEVPGVPLDQWSMDAHADHLRIATTIPGAHGADSVNDVYVLDQSLDVTGSVEGLGETERIYSVRFEGDEGHVVTFRQIDPFYTLDLADPTDPRVEGELKIPGVSHYLHTLDDAGDRVLGVGEEDRSVKLSLFDVSDRENPVEEDVLRLEDEPISEVNRNHHAFLQDAEHEAFVIPGHERTYVFSYANDSLEEVARVDVGGTGVRAAYVDDAMYVIGSDEVVVLDRGEWTEQSRLELP